jgi:structural maintenance of chromosome 2
MWVEEITIDGFKSFARRTTVPGMDPQFNAITGLNGSGKSNILDSICFVLGITNMQQVRIQRTSSTAVEAQRYGHGPVAPAVTASWRR